MRSRFPAVYEKEERKERSEERKKEEGLTISFSPILISVMSEQVSPTETYLGIFNRHPGIMHTYIKFIDSTGLYYVCT